MHNHGESKQGTWMMWAMMLCCALPVIWVVLFGAGGNALGTPAWIIFGGIVVMVVVHFFTMSRSHTKNHDIDPVCGMKTSNSTLKYDYHGKSYYFCSIHCKDQFIAHPGDYID